MPMSLSLFLCSLVPLCKGLGYSSSSGSGGTGPLGKSFKDLFYYSIREYSSAASSDNSPGRPPQKRLTQAQRAAIEFTPYLVSVTTGML
jgi:hypothetical protein